MPPKPPKSGKGLAARLTHKVGPLPVWAWAAAILGAYLLYSRVRSTPSSGTASSDSTPASPSDTTNGDTGGAQTPSSGQGTPADNLSGPLLDAIGANGAQVDALGQQLQQLPTFADLGQLYDAINASGAPSGSVSQAGPASSATSVTSQAAREPAGKQTQHGVGVLKWGGKTFTTQASFDAWAHSKGSSAERELNSHPMARSIYGTLQPRKPAVSKPHPKAPVVKKKAAPKAKPAARKPAPKKAVKKPVAKKVAVRKR